MHKYIGRILLLLGYVCCMPSHEDELRKMLLQNYSSSAIPATRTAVSVRFTVLHLEMNEETQSLDMNVWTSMEWYDPRLQWDEKKYNIKKLSFPRENIWHPDLSLYNNAVSENFNHFADSLFLVYSIGTVLWVPPASVKAMCVMDMTNWPHDIHNCTAKFGSWVHDGDTVDVIPKDEVVLFEDVTMYDKEKNLSRGEWKILGTAVQRQVKYYKCCTESYVTILVTVLMERSAPAYAWLVQMPCIVLSLLTVVVFLLPPSSGEKVILGGIGLILDLFFLMAVSQIIGHAPSHTPLIVKLIGKQLILTMTSVIVCAIILRMVKDPHCEGLPRFIKGPLLFLSPCFFLNGYRKLVTSGTPYTRTMKGEDLELNEGSNGRGLFGPENNNKGKESDWILLAAFIDRICLVIFITIFLVNITCFSGVL